MQTNFHPNDECLPMRWFVFDGRKVELKLVRLLLPSLSLFSNFNI